MTAFHTHHDAALTHCSYTRVNCLLLLVHNFVIIIRHSDNREHNIKALQYSARHRILNRFTERFYFDLYFGTATVVEALSHLIVSYIIIKIMVGFFLKKNVTQAWYEVCKTIQFFE